jgi:hypothetical protein
MKVIDPATLALLRTGRRAARLVRAIIGRSSGERSEARPAPAPCRRPATDISSLSAIEIGGHRFELVGGIQPEPDEDGSIRGYMPQSRYRNHKQLPMNKYGAGPFCKFKISNGFPVSGVYILAINGKVRYVGECENLSTRFNAGYGNISPKNCFRGGQETNCRLNNLIYNSASAGQNATLWFLQTKDHKVVEATIRATSQLAWNRV